MIQLSAVNLDATSLNNAICEGQEHTITDLLGQRFLGASLSGGSLELYGIPGNALGAYLNGAAITVHGNAQDAVGDTMNEGSIIIHGSIGDAAGYAMRGGAIYVRDSAGYRAGVHMKAYEEKQPLLVIGGRAGSFLGEYQAGGTIVVLGLHKEDRPIVGNFPCTGMHGGKVFLRSDGKNLRFPSQVKAAPAEKEDLLELSGYVKTYCEHFGTSFEEIMEAPFLVITPDTANPYRQLYVAN